MATAKTNHNKKRKHSFILVFVIIALSSVLAISLVSVNRSVRQLKAELAVVEEEKKDQEAKNEKLKKVLDSGEIDEYVEEIARDKLGYVKPGERVYYDISANN